MKVSLKWLGEFFPESKPGMDPISLVEKLRVELPLSGIEIGGWQKMGAGIEDVIVAQILEFQKHPNADKLNVCKVATGKEGEILQIVCGAPNVKAGAKVALAPVGCTLPGGLKIKQAAIRGVDSSGMLCSEKELGFSEESNGILILPDSAPVGSGLVKALGLADEVWEVELTPDRADCLSHLGLAREVARFTGRAPVLPERDELNPSDSGDVAMLSVEVPAQKACAIYGAQLFENVSNIPTPDRMRRTLEKLGIRSHNSVVDITNFVLMEQGHPLHAFDADKLVGSKIIVRFAKNGEKLTTLDGVVRTLTNEDLVIADAEKPVALAGVMGGLDSGVTAATTRIVLESAVFDANVVRATARRHKIHSDASHRFERGVDPAGCLRASGRASLLLRQITSARRRGSYIEIKSEKADKLLEAHSLNFSLRSIKDVVGLDVTPEELIAAFHKVGIESSIKSPNVLKVTIPTHRLDLVREIDLVEESARLLGYDKIPDRYPEQHVRVANRTGGLYRTLRQIRHRMVETGLCEMMPYSFISADKAKFIPQAKLVELKNPLSAEWQFMRPNLFFGLLDVVSRHAALGQPRGGFFDLGGVFEQLPAPTEVGARVSSCREAWQAGWALMGPRFADHWSSDKKSVDRKASVDFYDGKGIVESLVQGLTGVDGRWASLQYLSLEEALANPAVQQALATEAAWIPVELLHPGRSALLTLPGRPPGEIVGYVGELHPATKRDLLNLPAGLQLGVVVGELRFLKDLLAASETPPSAPGGPRGKIVPSRRLPVVERDVALVVSKMTRSGDMEKSFRKAVGAELLDVACVDRFELPDGKVSLAWRFWLQGLEKTFTDAEITALMDKAVSEAKSKHGAELRS